MNILTYVNNVLTVVKDGKKESKQVEKPSFITGSSFYYEPTLKIMDGQELTTELINEVETFLESYTIKDTTPTLIEEHAVDKDGNYLGIVSEETYAYSIVPSAPDTSIKNPYWNGTEYVEGVLIDAATNKTVGEGDTRSTPNTFYAPASLLPTDFKQYLYTWDKVRKEFVVDLSDAKRDKKSEIKSLYSEAVRYKFNTDDYAQYEVTTFSVQEAEARAFASDSNASTPFIDALLESRNILGESKSQLATIILAKSEEFKSVAKLLGKCQRLLKDIDSAPSLSVVKSIKW